MTISSLFGHLPFPRIKLKGEFALRQLRKSDSSRLLSIYKDEEATRYIAGDRPDNLVNAEKFVERSRARYTHHQAIFWAITSSDRLIGIIILKDFDFDHGFGTTGYLLDRNYWGQGIISMALKAVADYAFFSLQLQRVEAQVYVDHPASCRVLEKNNFVREGRLRKNFMIDGKFEDSFIYGLIREDHVASR